MKPGAARVLAVAALLAASSCMPTPGQPAAYPRPTLAGPSELLEYERTVVRTTNANRAVIRMPALEIDPLLTEIAREHSRAMATGDVAFGHGGFDARAERAMAELGVRGFGENVATNDYRLSSSPQRTVQDWMGSPPHRANIEGRYDLTGVGVAQTADGRFFITQLFAIR